MKNDTKNQPLPATPNFPELEEQILEFWDQDKTFEKSVEQRNADKSYVFYDGPPFATGLPHYGHILASTIKDVIPRYWTMKGFRVERVWGWDCHGLPIENMIEGELQLKGGKKGIEAFGIDKFNQACRSAILRFDKDWEVVVRRIGRWVNFKNSYKTMDKNYMESVWWGFQELTKKGLIYEGRKIVLYCPRCATPLSNFEIAMDNSYKDVQDNSIYVKFELVKPTVTLKPSQKEYFLAWTTTPWTLPGNVGLAVQAEAEYSLVEIGNDLIWMAHDKVDHIAKMHEVHKAEVIKTIKGKELAGLDYKPLFNYMPLDGKKAHYMLTADFVSLTDGTGIVHTAAIYGEDDYALAQRENLPCVPTLDDEGKFLPIVTPVAGMFYKKAEQTLIDLLVERDFIYLAEKYTHSYPFCYRCSTPLYYNAVPAWFINVQQLKKDLVAANESISWFPEHLKHGRFGKGLETAPDWNISRSRYWGTPMPVWQAQPVVGQKAQPGELPYRVVGSLEELKKWAVEPEKVTALTDIHREFLDDLEVWVDDAKTLKGKRIKEVFDCWVESGSMPFASIHYPFENKQQFEDNYPAQFISEYIAQTRAWFYCMHVLSVGIFGKPSFQNALTTGTILAEDGTKMSKSKKNYPDPMGVINKYGVDSLRLYLMSSVVMKADNLNFSEKEVDELRKKVFVIWWNVANFYFTFANQSQFVTSAPKKVTHVMDRWVLSRLQTVIKQVTEAFDAYDVVRGSRVLIDFINEVSTWYLRQSRDRIKNDQTGEVGQVFGYVLYRLAQLFAPVSPFFSEFLFQRLTGQKTSVHLSDWPVVEVIWQNPTLEKEMEIVRKVVETGHAARKAENLKIRQPLSEVHVTAAKLQTQELLAVIEAELNVKKISWVVAAADDNTVQAVLETTLTPELLAEGQAREVMRTIQQLRKDAGVDVNATVKVELPSWPEAWTEQIKTKTKVSELTKGAQAKIV